MHPCATALVLILHFLFSCRSARFLFQRILSTYTAVGIFEGEIFGVSDAWFDISVASPYCSVLWGYLPHPKADLEQEESATR